MAFLQIDLKSKALGRKAHLNVFLPVDVDNKQPGPYKTLYLLHGIFGNSSSWVTSSCVQRYADAKHLCVVMPDGENGFYTDHPDYMNNFSRYVGEELVQATREMLPLSDKREDTMLGGFSMGGYGALYNGLKYADTFSRIISFSAALHLLEFEPGDPRRQLVCNEDQVMGPYREAVKSDKNPAICLHQLQEKVEQGRASYPQMYMICGLQDSLIDANRSFHEKLVKAGVPVIYREYPGKHEFEFWNQHVETMITWLMEEN